MGWMTDGQLAMLYRDAKNKKEQLEILAQLNACSVEKITKRLNAMGIETVEPKAKRKRDRYREWSEADILALLDLKHSGASVRKISKALDRSETAIRSVLCKLDPSTRAEGTEIMRTALQKWHKKQREAVINRA